jgi:hypothetical protein
LKKNFYLLSEVTLAVSKVRHLPPLRYGHAASSTTNTGRHDIAEILLKVALSTIDQINQIKHSISLI